METIASKGPSSINQVRAEIETLANASVFYSGFFIQLTNKSTHKKVETVSIKEIVKDSSNLYCPAKKENRENSTQKKIAKLPILSHEKQILEAITQNSVTIIVAETGSGKTTQLPQIIYKHLLSNRNLSNSRYNKPLIVCTQPRRIAAINVATTVSNNLGFELGREVGYSVRFDDKTSWSTRIKFATDAYLVREAMTDPYFSVYDYIIIDEAHERSVSSDLLLSLLKITMVKKPTLKIIITSATLDIKAFIDFFPKANILNIPGRAFPVDVTHYPFTPKDFIAAAVQELFNIHLNQTYNVDQPSDILVFLTGIDDIFTFNYLVYQKFRSFENSSTKISPLILVPVISFLSKEDQSHIFKQFKFRKCVVATNIAETSITVVGIKYVVDCGYVKTMKYNSKLRVNSLCLEPCTKSASKQRAGRAGRMGHGYCQRLFTQEDFLLMQDAAKPKILCTNIESIILILLNLNIKNIFEHAMINRPNDDNLARALYNLYFIGLLSSKGELTMCGRFASKFPVLPEHSRFILEGVKLGVAEDVIVIVSTLQIDIQVVEYSN
ncbi:uncharacterized protein LOC142598076 [Dermatophagoides farinae]|uniref:uncharacterized protein LOC142598076 n=1 Tax=Dermatophagoides farinae TaxID=6954 RepID=UPI003F635C9D